MAHHQFLYGMQTKNDFYMYKWLEKKSILSHMIIIQNSYSMSINKALLECSPDNLSLAALGLQGK